MSGLINKVKDALHSDKDKTHHEQPEGTHGTHNSRAANAADPRIDSDRDHRANPTTTGGLGGSSAHTGPTAGGLGHNTGTGHTAGGLGQSTGAGHTAGGLGSTGGIGHRSENLPEGTVGPHSSRAANAADPRVDSDLDSSRSHGAGHTTGGLGSTGGIGHRSENLPGSTHSSGLHGSNNSGLPGATHSSGLHEGSGAGIGSHSGGLNAGHNAGGLNTYDQTTTGASGLSSYGAGAHGPTSGLSGSHGPNSGLSGSHGPNAGLTGGRDAGAAYGSGPGPAENTAGPHKSDLLNKADPRVDSNLDGSKTVGKEKTFDQSGTNFAGRDPTDAAQVPPSVLQKHVPSEIAHDDPSSDHGRRHSSVNKEHHTGL